MFGAMRFRFETRARAAVPVTRVRARATGEVKEKGGWFDIGTHYTRLPTASLFALDVTWVCSLSGFRRRGPVARLVAGTTPLT